MKLDTAVHYKWLLARAEEYLPEVFHFQNMREGSEGYGGWIQPEKGFSEPGIMTNHICLVLNLYCNRDSRYYRDPELLERAGLFLTNLHSELHGDGTLDLKETNFHCASTAAFTILQGLVNTYRIFEEYGSARNLTDEEKAISGSLYNYFERAGEGILNGGFHTPNHRWVCASALAWISSVTGDRRLSDYAGRFLSEGIDCNSEGEYTEKSIAIYNKPVNNALIVMARELDRPELLDHVERNLSSLIYYLEPDDTLYSLSSSRQDNGSDSYPYIYYETFMHMFLEKGKAEYAWWAEYIFDLARRNNASYRDFSIEMLGEFMLDERLRTTEAHTVPVSKEYEKFNEISRVVRMRSGDATLGLLAGNSSFLKYQKGDNQVLLRFTSSFFGEKGRFSAVKVEKRGAGRYSLSFSSRWGYVRPFESYDGSPFWHEMDHSLRGTANMQDHAVEADVSFQNGKATVRFSSRGTEGIPYRIEIILKSGGRLETGSLIVDGEAGRTAVFRHGEAVYHRGLYPIHIRGGMAGHIYTEKLRGGEPKMSDRFTLYLTGFTPADHTLEIF